MSKGGGGPTNSTVTQTDLPGYAKPYTNRLFKRAEAESKRKYEPYKGDRVAGMDDKTQAADIALGRMGSGIGGLNSAQQATRQAMTGSNQYNDMGAGNFSQYGFDPAAQYDNRDTGAIMGADLTNAQGAFGAGGPSQFGFAPTDRYGVGGASSMAGDDLANAQGYFGGENPQGYEFGDARQFDSASAQQYMSPYMQNVVDVQKDQANLDFDRAQSGRDANAVQAGAFGGSRGAVVDALAQESLGRRQGEIQAQGQQAAYEDAQRMFGDDRAVTMQRENERAAELGRTQGLGMDDYWNTLSQRQGARGMGFDVLGSQSGQDFAREQAQASELGRTQGLSMDDYYNKLAQRQDARGSAFDVLGNQAADDFAREQEQAGELGRVQSDRDASRFQAADTGLAALGMKGDMAAQLADLGGMERQAELDYNDRMRALGNSNEARQQERMDVRYQDFLAQQAYPGEQLNAYSDLLRGNISGNTMMQQQFAQANPYKDLLGAGITGLSMANMGG